MHQLISRFFSQKSRLSLFLLGLFLLVGCSSRSAESTSQSSASEETESVSEEGATSTGFAVDSSVSTICNESELVEQAGSNLYGVIEIGSSGVKAEVVQKLPAEAEGTYDLEPREEDIEPKDVDPINPRAQGETVEAVTGTFLEMQRRFAIPCEHIVIYGSSGFASKATNGEVLVEEIESTIGRDVDLISEADEATYVFKAVVPPHRLNEVVMIDVGSGNTKGAYLDGSGEGAANGTFSVGFGTKSFTTAVDEARGAEDFIEAAEKLKVDAVMPEVRGVMAGHPALDGKPRVYLAGGISWALTTLVRPCGIEQVIETDGELASEFAPLSAEDINTFYINAIRDPKTLFSPDLSACDEEMAERVKGDIETIRDKVFTVDQLTGGAEVLRALSTEMDFSDKAAIFFSRYAFEALPIGYLKAQID